MPVSSCTFVHPVQSLPGPVFIPYASRLANGSEIKLMVAQKTSVLPRRFRQFQCAPTTIREVTDTGSFRQLPPTGKSTHIDCYHWQLKNYTHLLVEMFYRLLRVPRPLLIRKRVFLSSFAKRRCLPTPSDGSPHTRSWLPLIPVAHPFMSCFFLPASLPQYQCIPRDLTSYNAVLSPRVISPRISALINGFSLSFHSMLSTVALL